MQHQIAIPSHARSEAINGFSLRYLADQGIPRTNVRVFVAPEQIEDYQRNLDPGLYGELVSGALGVRGNHNAITNFYPDGVPLVRMDDDVRYIGQRIDEKRLEPVHSLRETIAFAFEQAHLAGASLWGLYPIDNPYFMKDKIRSGLSFIIGQFFGAINHHDEVLGAEIKEDYERTIQRYIKDGLVLRFDFLTAIAGKVGGNKGGLQVMDRAAMNEQGTDYLLAKYPEYVVLKKSRGNGYREIRLKDGTNRQTA